MTKYNIPSPDLQIDFSIALDQIRKIYLQDALSKIIETIDLSVLDRQLAKYVPQSSLKALATRGLRGEILFPVPCILETNPFILVSKHINSCIFRQKNTLEA
jgi:hypothetical protein